MKAADGKVLDARRQLSKAKDLSTDGLVEAMHDYSTALQKTVPAGKAFVAAMKAFKDDPPKDDLVKICEGCASSELLEPTYLSTCDHEMKLDEIDVCGGMWGRMVESADDLAEAAKKYDVDLTRVR